MNRTWYEDGDLCPECGGFFKYVQEACYCQASLHPPRGNCVSGVYECSGCGYAEEEEENQNNIGDKMKKRVQVRFKVGKGDLSEKHYTYFTDIDDLAVGDYVIVVVNCEPVVAVVSELHLSEAAKALGSKWVASKIDLTDYNKKVEREQLILEVDKACSQASPKMKELLEKLGKLDPTLNLIEMEK